MAVRPRGMCDDCGRKERRRLRFERLEDRRLLSLTHLYTFNDSLANDWIGSAHATLFNGAQVAGGQLVLANTGVSSGQASVVQYARLPAGALPDGDATVEVWFTAADLPDGTRVFDVGNQSGAGGDSYLSYTPQSSFGDSRGVLRPSGADERVAGGATTADGVEHVAAIVVDTSAGLLRLYVDGTETGTSPLDGANAGSVNDSLAYLGRSLFDAAPGFTGSINELRIYDDARGPADVAKDAADGPSTLTRSPLVRQMEYLDRGMVVVRRSSTQAYVGWRLLGTDPADVAFNLYRSAGGGAPVKLNATPLTQTTDFVDSTANFSVSNSYFVRPVVSGVEQDASPDFTLAAAAPVQQYLNVPLQIPPGGTTPSGESYTYIANDASVGDLDGDGQYEIIVKWDPSNSKDNSQSGYTGNTYIDAYKLDGTRLWRIDLGRNIRSGAHYTQFIVYDLDGDGKAEVAMRTAPGTVDGQGNDVLLPHDSARADYRNSSGYNLTSPEYLTIFDGWTGAERVSVPYLPDRGNVSQWGDSYGNRVDRFLMAVAYLDGVHPSLVLGRGIFGPQNGFAARNELTAWDFNGNDLTLRWWFKAGLGINGNINSQYVAQGVYNMIPADVDGDGKDEIIYGAMAVDDDGTPLYSTGLGHGDALHVSDMDPSRPGLEVFMPHETPSAYGPAGGEFRDARTGELLFGIPATGDVGRGVAGDIWAGSPGYEAWASGGGATSALFASDGSVVGRRPSTSNFLIWWDADLTRELFDGQNSGAGTPRIDKYGLSGDTRLLNLSGASTNNGTKATPSLVADLFGDWREEVIVRTSDNTALRIYTTTIAATSRLYTLMHDSQYREAIAWQNVGYNQPPNPSFFLGAGMAPPPTPQIYTVQAAPTLPGDYNGDHVVDAADYTVWRDTLGSGSDLRADGDGDQVIGAGDYTVWRQNFGAISSGVVITSVPGGGSASGQSANGSDATPDVALREQSNALLSLSPADIVPQTNIAGRKSLARSTNLARRMSTRSADQILALLDARPRSSRRFTAADGDAKVGMDQAATGPLADVWADLDCSLPRLAITGI